MTAPSMPPNRTSPVSKIPSSLITHETLQYILSGCLHVLKLCHLHQIPLPNKLSLQTSLTSLTQSEDRSASFNAIACLSVLNVLNSTEHTIPIPSELESRKLDVALFFAAQIAQHAATISELRDSSVLPRIPSLDNDQTQLPLNKKAWSDINRNSFLKCDDEGVLVQNFTYETHGRGRFTHYSREISSGVWRLTITSQKFTGLAIGVINSEKTDQLTRGRIVTKKGAVMFQPAGQIHYEDGHKIRSRTRIAYSGKSVTCELNMEKRVLKLFVDGIIQPTVLYNIPSTVRFVVMLDGSKKDFTVQSVKRRS
ncbi:hypothetical protein BLNAU_2265 [Blattamonas nauphoetae]|uniref:SPRY domain-containing protein n=1 Tax=Blattamonas nauphoetae TaxID=2049346 RepID=A0ABQ9YGE4_9EUKA|nr:hypothetical protein BLNAU_2265 [Blattamonas nauphoetae]